MKKHVNCFPLLDSKNIKTFRIMTILFELREMFYIFQVNQKKRIKFSVSHVQVAIRKKAERYFHLKGEFDLHTYFRFILGEK